MKFSSFLDEAVKVFHPDTDETPEYYDQADTLMQQVRIRYGRKELSLVAVDQLTDHVVGALYSIWGHGDGLGDLEGHPTTYFSWDVGVDPKYQGQTVGKQLIDKAFRMYNSEKHAYDDNVMMYVHVINPRLTDYLVRQYKLEVHERHGNEAILFKVG